MLIRYHAQRKHIIHSLNYLLYQLHTLSFLLAPSILAYLCRCATQSQFASADDKRSLRFWFFLVALVNAGSVWSHAWVGLPEGKAIILDFVGMGKTPTKFQLLLLDATIIFLQLLLTTISYETALAQAMAADKPDPLITLPETETIFDSDEHPDISPSSDMESSSPTAQFAYPPHLSKPPSIAAPHFPPKDPIIHLTLTHIYHRLTSPKPTPPQTSSDTADNEALSLPLPNTTTSRRITQTLQILNQVRVRRQQWQDEMRRARTRNGDRRRTSSAGDTDGGSGSTEGDTVRGSGRIPGAIEESLEED